MVMMMMMMMMMMMVRMMVEMMVVSVMVSVGTSDAPLPVSFGPFILNASLTLEKQLLHTRRASCITTGFPNKLPSLTLQTDSGCARPAAGPDALQAGLAVGEGDRVLLHHHAPHRRARRHLRPPLQGTAWPLCPYACATRCPVLTYARATRCPVL
eukprot:1827170-Rhodomonas_salina.5